MIGGYVSGTSCPGTMVKTGEYTFACDACGYIAGRSDINDFGDAPHSTLQKRECKRDGCFVVDGVCHYCKRVEPKLEPKPPIDWTAMDAIRAASKKKKARK